MKPEDRLYDHVDCGSQVVVTPDVTQLVRKHRPQLRRLQAFRDIRG
jgi:hypothetical protein